MEQTGDRGGAALPLFGRAVARSARKARPHWRRRLLLSLLLLSGVPCAASAQEPFVYPGRGQSAEQQERDKFACYQWAVQQTGFDPARAQASAPPQAAQAPSSPQQGPRGGALGGAARGAAVGAAGGAIAGDAGKGAAIGGATGALIGGFRRREAQRQQQVQQQQSAAAQSQQATAGDARREAYSRAYGACLEGRGYTVR